LVFDYKNINLPDSSANEPESHGFVTFQVKQVPNLATGTEINNNVGIYFDLNDPIITNTTLHTINPCINTINQTINSSPSACSTYTAPNGQVLSESGTYQIISQDANGCNTIHNITLSISSFEATATLVGPNTLQASSGVTYQWIDCNNNNTLIAGETNQNYTVTANGSYAVQVTENGCVDTSACVNIIGVGMTENTFGEAINLYPNPTGGIVTLISEKDLSNDVQVLIIDVLGQTIFSHNYINFKQIEFHIEGPSGVYFVEVASKRKYALFKVVKE
jgi:hypothetical protein